MIYDENHDPVTGISGEIIGAWIFAISLIGLVLFVVSIFD